MIRDVPEQTPISFQLLGSQGLKYSCAGIANDLHARHYLS